MPQTDVEKVRVYWDFKRSIRITFLGFYFSAFLAMSVLLNNLRDTSLWWTVFLWVPFILVVVFSALVDTMKRFRELAVKMSELLKKIESGQPLPDLTELLDIEIPSYWERWKLRGKKLSGVLGRNGNRVRGFFSRIAKKIDPA